MSAGKSRGIIGAMSDKKVQFFQFHAINEFMLPDFRQQILTLVFSRIDELSAERRNALNNQVKRHVTVPGFRNSTLAPAAVKARASVKAFEKSPDLVAQVLSAWYELHPELCQKVYDMLVERGWTLLPVEADRTKLPGFMVTWPKQDEFEVLNAAFREKYPDFPAENNDISLMAVWLSTRLPYQLVEPGEETNESDVE